MKSKEDYVIAINDLMAECEDLRILDVVFCILYEAWKRNRAIAYQKAQ